MSNVVNGPIIYLKSESDLSKFVQTEVDSTEGLFRKAHIIEIEIESEEQPRISLGRYTIENAPKGFVIYISPLVEKDTVVTQINKIETARDYELILHVANYGDKSISAEVWRLI